MSWPELAIVLSVFVLLQVVIFALFARKVNTDIRKYREMNGAAEREAKLLKLYSSIEEMMDGFEEYVNEIREDAENDRKEIQETSRQAALLLTRMNERVQDNIYTPPVQTVSAVQTAARPAAQTAVRPAVQTAVRPDAQTSANLSAQTIMQAQLRTAVPSAYRTAQPGRPAQSSPPPASAPAVTSPRRRDEIEFTEPPPIKRFEAIAGDSVNIIRPLKQDQTNKVAVSAADIAAFPEPPGADDISESRLGIEDKQALRRFATKTQKVRFLISRGFNVEETARELDIGKGEVQLIADLDK